MRKKRKTRRGVNMKYKYVQFTVFGINCDGLSGKKDSLISNIEILRPSAFFVQETKYNRKGQFKLKDYEIFEFIRKSNGGSILTGVHTNLSPVLVSDGSDEDLEILVVEGEISDRKCRFINGYAPQEYSKIDHRIQFFARIEQEVLMSLLNGCMVCIQMDANAKLGPDVVKGDPHPRSENGELLLGVIERNNLVVCNAQDICKGVITRRRTTVKSLEESVIDYLILSEDMFEKMVEMIIDENRTYSIAKYKKVKEGTKVIEADHNMLIGRFGFKVDLKKKNDNRNEIFLFNDPEGQRKFKSLTSGLTLSSCFLSTNIETASKKWFKEFNNIVHRSFKKVRIVGRDNKDKDMNKILKEKNEIRRKYDDLRNAIEELNADKDVYKSYFDLEDQLEEIDEKIGELTADKNAELIDEHVKNINCEEGGFSLPKMYSLKRKLFPKAGDTPAAMKDLEGNMVCNKQSLIKLYQAVYEERLSYKEIKPEWKDIKELQNLLFELRMEVSRKERTPEWTEKQIREVCKKLKNGKARDDFGLIYELFKEAFAGPDVFNSLTQLFNGMKEEMFIPTFMQIMGITSLYKNKGMRSDFSNQRGIFNLPKIRGILDKVIYEEVYDTIDGNLSDSNVGGRRGRNIRDHLFLIYGIINDVKNGDANPVCFQTFDIYKCFDEMDYVETHNDLYDAGVVNDLFTLIATLDEKCSVRVKTPCGSTDRFELQKLVMQGSVFGPIKCSVQIDTLGRESLIENSGLYLYKKKVNVMALSMVDDVCSVNECNSASVEANAMINMKMEQKKLRLSKKKCSQIHIGKNNEQFCNTALKVHDDAMEKKTTAPYLGDILSSDGSLDATIEDRRQKGVGIITKINGMVSNVSLGIHFFRIALTLRESMLINGILTNSEVWYGVKEKHFEELENLDMMLLRKFFQAHSKTAKESFFLECGILPIKNIVAKRKFMYLRTILKRPEDDLLKKVYKIQKSVATQDDWAIAIKDDMKKYDIELSDDQIQNTSYYKYEKLVRKKVVEEGLNNLNTKAASHSKSERLMKSELVREKYLDDPRFSRSDCQLLFQIRTRMLPVKTNFPTMWNNDKSCRTCLGCVEIESQEHLLTCPGLRKNVEIPSSLKYDDVFDHPDKQYKIVKAYRKLMREQEIMLNCSEQGSDY